MIEAEPAPAFEAKSPLVRNALQQVGDVFDRLGAYSYLTAMDRSDFGYYRALYEEALRAIDRRIERGTLIPADLRDFPDLVRFKHYAIDAALFIGSFDPFQMTHLAMALRYLSSDLACAPVVFVIPEGHSNSYKPHKSDYAYRRDLVKLQLEGVFNPFIVPLDLGQGADTIEIVRRFIALFPGSTLRLSHILGSDVLPFAAALLPEDLVAWNGQAALSGVDFSYRAFVIKRADTPDPRPIIELVRSMGLAVDLDERSIATPSSTDFRENRAFSIVFPTESIVRHMEILFRLNLNKPWRPSGP
ncbi:MAG TPA: hypothetical protein DCG47_15100 [Spirochaetaceae bacterium]|jgi:hypothetical protein|nr:hypothetical protein [Spirochaetaceae bacterium]